MSGLQTGWAKMNGVPAGRDVLWSLIGAMVSCALIVAFLVLPTLVSAAEACPNEARRVEQGAVGLPDCRAFELVTPVDKESDEPRAVPAVFSPSGLGSEKGARASETGDRMAWASEYSLPGSAAPGLDYLSTRGADGWSSEDVIPPQSAENGLNCPALVAMAAYSSDLSRGVLADGYGQLGSLAPNEELQCGHDEPLLVPGEPEVFQNLFLRDNDSRAYELVNVTPANAPRPVAGNGEQYFPAAFLGASNDLSRVVFEEELQITPEAPFGDDLYEWNAGAVRLVSILPDGTPVVGRLAAADKNTDLIAGLHGGERPPYNLADSRHAVSATGSRIFFEAGGDLFVRENGEQPDSPLVGGACAVSSDACTLQVDLAQGGPGTSGGGKFVIASEDGSKIFFTDESRLTSDSNAEAGKPDLYEYDLARASGQRLVDVTPGTGEAADVVGVSGASSDASYLYFVAEGSLTGAQQNARGVTALAGQPNLYLLHDGVTTFIVTMDPNSDACDWASPACVEEPLLGGLTARVSTNGVFAGFESDRQLTGYENNGAHCVPENQGLNHGEVKGYGPGACEEVFVYDASSNTLSCASCDPSGAPPAGPAIIRFPAPASQDDEMRNAYPERNVSDAGQVFFESPDPLTAFALDGERLESNGKLNVYEYEDGQPHLISGGNSSADSYFLDASVDGGNVFFVTAQPLLGRDGDAVYDIYDARVDGGFPEPVAPGVSCEGEGCRGAAGAVPVFGAPSSVAFSGTGNFSPPPPLGAIAPIVSHRAKPLKCRKGYLEKRGKCVKKPKVKAKKGGAGKNRAKKSAKGRK